MAYRFRSKSFEKTPKLLTYRTVRHENTELQDLNLHIQQSVEDILNSLRNLIEKAKSDGFINTTKRNLDGNVYNKIRLYEEGPKFVSVLE